MWKQKKPPTRPQSAPPKGGLLPGSRRDRELQVMAETAAATALRVAQQKERVEVEPADDGGSSLWRMRRQLRPVYVGAGVWGLGFLLTWALPKVAGTAWMTDPGVFVATGTVGVVALLVAYKLTVRAWRTHVMAGIVTAVAWLTYVITNGGSNATADFVLAAGTVACSARWWQHVRTGYPICPPSKPRPIIKTAGPVRPDREDVMGNWYAYLYNQSQPMAKAELIPLGVNETEESVSESYLIDGVPGVHSVEDANSKTKSIASGLRRTIQDIILEPAGDEDSSNIKLTVVKKSPIKVTQDFTEAGWIQEGKYAWVSMARYADGLGTVKVPVLAPNSARHITLFGGQGSGKSGILNQLCVSISSGVPTIRWYLDGQEGASSPQLLRHSDWAPTGKDRGKLMLRALKKEFRRRERYLKRSKRSGITPSEAMPLLLLVIDECHEIWNRHILSDKEIKEWGNLVRKARKLAATFIAATQHPSLDSFAGSDTIRSLMQQYTTLVLRTTSGPAKNILRIAMNPKDLPALPGYGFIESGEPGTRQAPFRAFFLDDEPPEDGGESIADQWFLKFPTRSLPDHAAAAIGREYVDRKKIAAEEWERLQDESHDFDDYDDDDGDDLDEDDEDFEPATISSIGPPKFPGPVKVRVPDGLTDSQAAIYRAVLIGATKGAAIMKKAGLSKGQTYNLLGQLVDAGHLVKHDGEYRTAASLAEIAALDLGGGITVGDFAEGLAEQAASRTT
ncbi:hypothetical protein ABN028_19895 [Actinopolymorpha sp. B17G11]|uniref:zonular occludens toxin domain-containing protein n=1 Tax=Actinopolymorpha sp. B17G11 TaxID=3160861 RepID=UPI0032E37475